MNGLQATIAGGRYGSLTVLGQVDLSVAANQTVVLLGSNGAGKTTALRAIMGTVATGTRTLRIDGRDVTSLPTWRLAQAGIVMVPDGARCFPNLSVRENLLGAYTATHARRDAMQFERLYREVVGFFPILDERAEQLSGTMSGGQRQMLAVCAFRSPAGDSAGATMRGDPRRAKRRLCPAFRRTLHRARGGRGRAPGHDADCTRGRTAQDGVPWALTQRTGR